MRASSRASGVPAARRRTALATGLVALALALGGACATTSPTVLLVRHAEKLDDSRDPPLTEEGHARADALAALFANARVAAVYTSEYERTRDTAAPLAKAHGLTPVVIRADETDALLAALETHAADELVVVVGHSNTLPGLIERLGGEAPRIAHGDYGRLFLVQRHAAAPTEVIELAYDAGEPGAARRIDPQAESAPSGASLVDDGAAAPDPTPPPAGLPAALGAPVEDGER